jgi:serine phosphatase RsbU (regulator of sigma subunit)/anti-sigma regulatory factor (Ser/Thr protein kinase)
MALIETFGKLLGRGSKAAERPRSVERAGTSIVERVDITENDPLLAYLQTSGGVVDIEALALASPGLDALRERGIKLIVPLINQGDLIGLLNLGPRLSEQEYSADDRRLLENLARHVAPAVMVAQLVRQQEAAARNRERIEQELRVATLIQQNFLPHELPELPGWRLAAHYQPAREVGGDFYDFIALDDGRLGLVIGDVTDKGVPAALVMASTRSVIRGAAQRLTSPADVLRRVNDLLCPDIPPNMFATCMYCILDPVTGRLVYSNAGHNLPYLYSDGESIELRATGMPLGLLPGMSYDDHEVIVKPGESVVFYSDGLVEAHSASKDMFSFPRLQELVAVHGARRDLIEVLCDELERFTDNTVEQEDDVTIVTLVRESAPGAPIDTDGDGVLSTFEIASEAGNERLAIERVAVVVEGLLDERRLDRLKTAVGEATMNAMEHGNKYQSELPVLIRVSSRGDKLIVAVSDSAGSEPIPEATTPDLYAKLGGLQTPRGWGLFLIENMVDELRTSQDGLSHTIELIFALKEGTDGN